MAPNLYILFHFSEKHWITTIKNPVKYCFFLTLINFHNIIWLPTSYFGGIVLVIIYIYIYHLFLSMFRNDYLV